MNLGIIAHNSKKVLIEDFCIAYKNILAKHEVYATGTTGRRIEEATSLHVHKFLAGSIGGDKQFMEMEAFWLYLRSLSFQIQSPIQVSSCKP